MWQYAQRTVATFLILTVLAIANLLALWQVLRKLRKIGRRLRDRGAEIPTPAEDKARVLAGRALCLQLADKTVIDRLADVEFSVFSEFGDDGIIQWLLHRLGPLERFFVEFGVENYQESNTRFLLMNNNWQGLVMDGSDRHMAFVRQTHYYPRHTLVAQHAFITAENIVALLEQHEVPKRPGVFHIDLDGNDYWVWKALDAYRPTLMVVEYNAVFGESRAITVPYDPAFQRTRAHPSNLYFGASLAALRHLAEQRGYVFVGCNGAGNNAYFIDEDAMTPELARVAERARFINSHFRESRDADGRHSLLGGQARLEAIRGCAVVDVVSGETSTL